MNFYLINKTRWKVPKPFFDQALKDMQTLLPLKHQKQLSGELGIILVGESAMHKLNSTYRHKNYSTDILSFDGQHGFLGELVICSRIVQKQAREHGIHPYEELSYLLLHGILHLLGYDHEHSGPKRAKQMLSLQDRVFEQWRRRGIPGVLKNGKKKSRYRL